MTAAPVLVIAEDQDLPPGAAQSLEPPPRETTRRQIAEIHDRVAGGHHLPPRAEQLVVHLLRRPVRSPEDADRRCVTQVEVRPHPNVRVVLLTQLARLRPSRLTEQTPKPRAFVVRPPEVVKLLTEFRLVQDSQVFSRHDAHRTRRSCADRARPPPACGASPTVRRTRRPPGRSSYRPAARCGAILRTGACPCPPDSRRTGRKRRPSPSDPSGDPTNPDLLMVLLPEHAGRHPARRPQHALSHPPVDILPHRRLEVLFQLLLEQPFQLVGVHDRSHRARVTGPPRSRPPVMVRSFRASRDSSISSSLCGGGHSSSPATMADSCGRSMRAPGP